MPILTLLSTRLKICKKLNFEVLEHPAYIPDLASLDCLLLGLLQEALRGHQFTMDQQVKEAMHAWLVSQPKILF
jgi:hypothetical protein